MRRKKNAEFIFKIINKKYTKNSEYTERVCNTVRNMAVMSTCISFYIIVRSL